jgi:hypothetical protein
MLPYMGGQLETASLVMLLILDSQSLAKNVLVTIAVNILASPHSMDFLYVISFNEFHGQKRPSTPDLSSFMPVVLQIMNP